MILNNKHSGNSRSGQSTKKKILAQSIMLFNYINHDELDRWINRVCKVHRLDSNNIKNILVKYLSMKNKLSID